MDPIQSVPSINIFQKGQLTLGAGSARIEKVIDPDTERLDVANVDQIAGGRPVVIPRRANGSDVEVAGQQGLAAQSSLADRAAHYAQHRGTVELGGFFGGSKYTVAQSLGTSLVLEDSKGAQKVVDLTKGTKIKWGAVTPAFEERRTASWRLDLRNTAGADALQVQGDVAASMAVRYTLVLDAPGAGFDQHALGAQMTPVVEVTNRTNVDMTEMALAIKLNEQRMAPPRAASRGAPMPAGVGRMESADIGDVSEGQASGVITMPIRAAGTFHLAKGQTEWVNFAGAAAGRPNDPATSLAVKVDQTLGFSLAAYPSKKVGAAVESKSSPLATYKLPEAAVARPAGSYEIFDEGDLALSQQVYQFTKKGEALQLMGGTFAALTGTAKYTTTGIEEGTWAPVVDTDGRRSHEEAVHAYRMQVELDVASTSQVARDTDVSLNVAQFSEGVKDVKVSVAGRPVTAEVVDDMLKVRVPVSALKADVSGSGKLLVTFTGLNRERRNP